MVYFRPSWDETFMEMTVIAAKRSMCIYYKVGALIARNKTLLSMGYNGPVAGEPHCEHANVGCAKMKDGVKLPAGSGICRGAHAEINAISNAANIGVSVRDATLYVTFRPCWECSKHIINAGITKVVYLNDYDGDENARQFLEMKIHMVQFCKISQMKLG